jgi:hypothetical protein
MFKFRPEITQEHKDTFMQELKNLKNLDCVKGHRLVVGGPSLTDPIERSKGFEIALLSLHENMGELEKYQASKEHHWFEPHFHFMISSFTLANLMRTQGNKHLHVSLQGRLGAV